jgi:molybdopterin molybdotransferase
VQLSERHRLHQKPHRMNTSKESELAAPNEACGAGADGNVIPVDIAATKAVAISRPVRETEKLTVMSSAGRVLAGDVVAEMDLPPFDNSAMDGYAVRTSDFRGAGPWKLSVAGRIAAGDPSRDRGLSSMEAIRIFTGAPVPAGFDAVIMQENCERDGDRISDSRLPRKGENVRRTAEDVGAGTSTLQSGEVLTPQRLALLAAQGFAMVEVLRKVRIGLISTGSELRDPGQPLAPGQIYNSNRVMIHAMLAQFRWAEAIDFGIVPDRREALVEAFGEAACKCDVLVTTGGVSAGEEDHVVSPLDHHGGKLDVLKVAMRPGKPVKIGLMGGMFFAGLPGNPNAALVTFRQIALPAIRAIAGLKQVEPHWLPAASGFSYAKRLGRTEFVPVGIIKHDELGRPVLEMLGRGSSSSLMSMAPADGIAVLPPGLISIELGMPLRFESFCGC